ncbi:uncharacterized protein LOC114311827 [Camellia sinensis]|uniref:uncharacterized protein LOC114311827 n=1 Tax=Camellia sinensis TaxID=4442 RepID=UPI00103558C9|nr:uncharacterized protein LOC114311827 [Camellia sinensis]
MMTCRGQGGETYQIPFAPPLAHHELLGFYDLPPASFEYTRQSLELNASMMGMLQRSFNLLAIYSIPPPFQMSAAGCAPAGPSVPTRGGGRGGTVFPRTKVGRTHVGSSSWAPVPDDDESEAETETETEAEAEAEAESSEEETRDGSDSDDGVDDDAPGPSSRKRTRQTRRLETTDADLDFCCFSSFCFACPFVGSLSTLYRRRQVFVFSKTLYLKR